MAIEVFVCFVFQAMHARWFTSHRVTRSVAGTDSCTSGTALALSTCARWVQSSTLVTGSDYQHEEHEAHKGRNKDDHQSGMSIIKPLT